MHIPHTHDEWSISHFLPKKLVLMPSSVTSLYFPPFSQTCFPLGQPLAEVQCLLGNSLISPSLVTLEVSFVCHWGSHILLFTIFLDSFHINNNDWSQLRRRSQPRASNGNGHVVTRPIGIRYVWKETCGNVSLLHCWWIELEVLCIHVSVWLVVL